MNHRFFINSTGCSAISVAHAKSAARRGLSAAPCRLWVRDETGRQYRAYAENPRLLPDSVLEGLRQELQIRFLREVPLSEVRAETAANYVPRPEFYRAIADHIAGMTDSYCIADYRELVTE